MEFVSPDPDALVRAANVRATLDAFSHVPELGQKVVEAHNIKLDELRPDNFIPVQRWLDALKDIQERVGKVVLRKVGRGIIASADFPPQFTSIDAIIESMNDIYYLNHKGNVGQYRTSKEADGSFVVKCETPYPRAFEHGLVEGFAEHKKLTQGKRYFVKYEDGPDGSDVTCILTVKAL
jgi:hypothetical protein